MRARPLALVGVAALALALSIGASGCSFLFSTIRGAVADRGGPIAEGEHVRGDTSGGGSQRSISCGAASSSPQHVWTFVAPRTATYVVDSTTSDYDGVLAAYDANGAELACNDDHTSTRASEITIAAQAGQTIELVQGGYSGHSGHYELWVMGGAESTAPGGVVASAQPLAADTSVTGDTRGQPMIAGIECVPASPMQEWLFAVPADATYLFQVDSDYDAYLGVLATPQDGGGALGCNDDWTDTRHARAVVELAAGTTVRVVVGGFSQQSGAYSLTAATVSGGGALTERQAMLFAPGATDAEPDVCGAPAGSIDRTFTFTPPAEAFYSIYTDAPGWLVVSDGRRVVACAQLSADRRVGLALKARHRYSFVLELGNPSQGAYFLLVERAAPEAPDWQVPPMAPPLASMLPAATATAPAAPPTPPAQPPPPTTTAHIELPDAEITSPSP